MPVEKVDIPLRDHVGRTHGTVAIGLLPSASLTAQGLLLDLRKDTNRDLSLAPIQILEGTEYRYEFDLIRPGIVTTDRPELFEPDETSGRSGRLRPGLSTGTVPVAISVDGSLVGEIGLEVRSRKLDYLSQYRWMLRDLAESTAEIIMERFAASQQKFSSIANVDAKTLYQRFAFLKSLLEDYGFVAALHRILYRPYVAWDELTEQRSPNQSVRAGSRVARSVTRPGPRLKPTEVSERLDYSPLRAILPRTIAVQRTEETLDNFPNRFVKFALTRWRDQSAAVLDALSKERLTAPVTRGRAEATKVIGALDELLTAGLFREVGHLQRFASDNPVLLTREGYRDVYRAFFQFELAAQLSWNGGEDVYGAGQRNVAALYEYWAFMQVATVLSRLCNNQLDFSKLFEVQDGELNLGLKRGRSIVLSGSLARLGRTILVELWFNRTFSAGRESAPSWSKEMRPDCSLRMSPNCTPGAGADDVWIHFDAKYRVDGLSQIFGVTEAPEGTDQDVGESDSYAKRADLLKMHAYRDAIRRSAGAYVLYPGDSDEQCKKYHELLPGLGAFGLRPSSEGDAIGIGTLTAFLDDIITHVASQITQHERSRFWERSSFSGAAPEQAKVQAVSFLEQPPADTKVLLGYVKDAEHRAWIEQSGLYNLRGDNRRGSVNLNSSELAAQLVLLYGRDSDSVSLYRVVDRPLLKTRDEMVAMGYQRPKGTLYFCLSVAPLNTEYAMPTLAADEIRRVVESYQPTPVIGMPIVVSWLDLVERYSLSGRLGSAGRP